MVFPLENLEIWVDLRQYSRPIQTTTYPLFTKGIKQPPPNTGREVVQMCSNCRMEWDVNAAPELCTECPNTELINLEWLPGSDHHRTGFGPRQVCIPVLLPLAVPLHNCVYMIFRKQSAKAEPEAEAEAQATDAKKAKETEEEQTVCVRVVAVRPFGCSDAKFCLSVFPGARPRRRSRKS